MLGNRNGRRLAMVVLALASLALSTPAFADCGGGNGSNDPPSNGCNGNNPGNVTVDVSNTNVNANVNNNSNTSTNANLNWNDIRNTNTATGGSSTSDSSSTSNATGGSSTISNSGNSSATGGNATGGSVGNIDNRSSGGSATAAGGQGGNSSTNVNISNPKQYRNSPNVYAGNIAPTAPCIVGVTGGASALGAGFSFGRGREDKNCTRRETARTLAALGETDGAVALMCQDAGVAQAMPTRCAAATKK